MRTELTFGSPSCSDARRASSGAESQSRRCWWMSRRSRSSRTRRVDWAATGCWVDCFVVRRHSTAAFRESSSAAACCCCCSCCCSWTCHSGEEVIEVAVDWMHCCCCRCLFGFSSCWGCRFFRAEPANLLSAKTSLANIAKELTSLSPNNSLRNKLSSIRGDFVVWLNKNKIFNKQKQIKKIFFSSCKLWNRGSF